MKCVICGTTIATHLTHSYVHVYRDGEAHRRLFACSVCSADNGPFDRLIDSLPVDDNGSPLDVSRAELEALKLATDRKRLEKRLREARSVLVADVRKRFGQGRLDFAGRRLIGDDGLTLQWRTRAMPDKPVAYLNQQTTVGNVSLETCNEPATCED